METSLSRSLTMRATKRVKIKTSKSILRTQITSIHAPTLQVDLLRTQTKASKLRGMEMTTSLNKSSR